MDSTNDEILSIMSTALIDKTSWKLGSRLRAKVGPVLGREAFRNPVKNIFQANCRTTLTLAEVQISDDNKVDWTVLDTKPTVLFALIPYVQQTSACIHSLPD
ncbi:predicted protein [Histoplasma capsulatum G186AR]|uniref:Uncharacterized protein n=1 Tax=Ajellomyces capsulatus (strain G186AR / H82 / ATCC MYA-2454 / RMSCC 2432) TaxID=447093 RepID=C0NY31_AJECG|nr:uncharacterized protein HCBG_07825 [Histoplasma capsulatum G186AR]EEH03699.1 predicted protein [Histoplasma capsulatum G186AR]